MTDHPHQLYSVEFTQADQRRLAGFSCGAERWSKHVTEWIQGSEVFASMNRGTRVWLFETARGEVVGFGSVGTSRWKWPPPRGEKMPIVLIPMLGIDTRFRGQPSDPHWRYARQIMSHLINEGQRVANEWQSNSEPKPQWVVLMVHECNLRAIQFYGKCGFELIPNVVRQHHKIMKLWIGEKGGEKGDTHTF